MGNNSTKNTPKQSTTTVVKQICSQKCEKPLFLPPSPQNINNHPFIYLIRDVIIHLLAHYFSDFTLTQLCLVSKATREIVIQDQIWLLKLRSLDSPEDSTKYTSLWANYIELATRYKFDPKTVAQMSSHYRFSSNTRIVDTLSPNKSWSTVGTKVRLHKGFNFIQFKLLKYESKNLGNSWRIIAGIYFSPKSQTFPFEKGLLGAVPKSYGIVSHTGRMVEHKGGAMLASESKFGTTWTKVNDTVELLVDSDRGNMYSFVNCQPNIFCLQDDQHLKEYFQDYWFGISFARFNCTVEIRFMSPSDPERQKLEKLYYSYI